MFIAVQAIVSMVQRLLNAGAQNILVFNIPDVDTAPVARTNPEGATALSKLFNTHLLKGLASVDSTNITDSCY